MQTLSVWKGLKFVVWERVKKAFFIWLAKTWDCVIEVSDEKVFNDKSQCLKSQLSKT